MLENDVDMCAFTECEKLDEQILMQSLSATGEQWKLVEIYPKSDLKLFSKSNVDIHPIKEEKHFSCYKILCCRGESILLSVVHLTSAMFKDESARSMRACNTSEELRKIEESIFGKGEYKSIVVGDFNLQPYSQGISGVWGFNATMSQYKAKQISRMVENEKRFYYFNPMWHLIGNNRLAQGTYYSDNDQQDMSMFWYTFDEVLIRPYFIDKFNWDYFGVVEKTENYNFIAGHKINKEHFSDHLPIKFELVEED